MSGRARAAGVSCVSTSSFISRSSVSIRPRIRARKSFSLEVMLVQRSFQPPPLPTHRVVGGHVVLALARHVEASLLQGGDHAGPVLHCAVFDALQHVVPDHLARVGLARDPRPQRRRLEVSAVPRLLIPGARRVIRAAPAVLEVASLDERPIGLFPARRRDIEAPADEAGCLRCPTPGSCSPATRGVGCRDGADRVVEASRRREKRGEQGRG